ncbi:MAG: hypothetical protein IT461_04520 [Planctomycetes bacterium]|nr:hypothetical protein [Planctomycetota bacterium]
MLARMQLTLSVALLVLFATPTAIVADPPDAEWLSWTVKDCKNDTISLTEHQGHKVFVIVFSPGNDDSCNWMSAAAAYIREHPTKAKFVLGLCTDDGGAKALKLHIRQKEYTKRVAAWQSEQAAAKQTAEQAGETFIPTDMPDFVEQIEDELADDEDLATLMAHYYPFKTASRCDAMWTWLTERMNTPQAAPRVIKFNAQGQKLNEWSEVPAQFSQWFDE